MSERDMDSNEVLDGEAEASGTSLTGALNENPDVKEASKDMVVPKTQSEASTKMVDEKGDADDGDGDDDDFEDMSDIEEEEDDEDEEDEMSADDETGESVPPSKTRIYLPGLDKLKPGEVLEHDPSAYVMLHKAEMNAPCLRCVAGSR